MASATTAYKSLQMEDAERHDNDGVLAHDENEEDYWRTACVHDRLVGKSKTRLMIASSSVLGVLLLCFWLGRISMQQQHNTPNQRTAGNDDKKNGAAPPRNATWQRVPVPENGNTPRTVVLAGQTMALG